MDRLLIIKWCKKVSILIIMITLLSLGSYIGYKKIYLPRIYHSLYEQSLNNIKQVDSIADELALLGQYKMSIKLLTQVAEKGVVKAQTKLALYVANYEDDYEKSSYWYLQAALKEDPKAQYNLAINYIYGYGVKQNFEKAIYWIQKSANNKYRWAQYKLGNLYLNGLAFYDLDYEHTNFWYDGRNIFRGLRGVYCKVTDEKLEEYLSNPKIVYIKSNLSKAKYYWSLSANQGCNKAKDALEKIYE